jgi:hypothetical protein
MLGRLTDSELIAVYLQHERTLMEHVAKFSAEEKR